MGEYTPDVSAFRGVYGQMCAEWCRDDALAEFDRFIARIKAEAREALLSDESVERAARALYETDRKEYDGDKPWPPRPHFIAEMYRERARAALTAAIGGE